MSFNLHDNCSSFFRSIISSSIFWKCSWTIWAESLLFPGLLSPIEIVRQDFSLYKSAGSFLMSHLNVRPHYQSLPIKTDLSERWHTTVLLFHPWIPLALLSEYHLIPGLVTVGVAHVFCSYLIRPYGETIFLFTNGFL